MKQAIWSGALPPYWVESAWWSCSGDDLILLTPGTRGTRLARLTKTGMVKWERLSSASLLFVCQPNVAVTAKVRDGRSDAVLFDFIGWDITTGTPKWTLPPDVRVRLPKWGVLQPTVAGKDSLSIKLDIWRSLDTGEPTRPPVPSQAPSRGVWQSGATALQETPEGLLGIHAGHEWMIPGLSLRDVLGLKGNCLVGVEPDRQLWGRDLTSGQVCWTIGYDADGIVVPSERVYGCDAEVWTDAATVPVLAVVGPHGATALRATDRRVILTEWPSRVDHESWPSDARVALLGSVAGGYLIVEELNDGTGCLWFVQ